MPKLFPLAASLTAGFLSRRVSHTSPSNGQLAGCKVRSPFHCQMLVSETMERPAGYLHATRRHIRWDAHSLHSAQHGIGQVDALVTHGMQCLEHQK